MVSILDYVVVVMCDEDVFSMRVLFEGIVREVCFYKVVVFLVFECGEDDFLWSDLEIGLYR